MTLLFVDHNGKKHSNEYFFASHEDAQSFIEENQTRLLKIHNEMGLNGIDFNAKKVRIINFQSTDSVLTFFETKEVDFEVSMFRTDTPQKRKLLSLYDALSYFFGDLTIVQPSVVEINGKIIPNVLYNDERDFLSDFKIFVSEEVSKMILNRTAISSCTVDGVPYGDSLILVNSLENGESTEETIAYGLEDIGDKRPFLFDKYWCPKVLLRYKQAAFERVNYCLDRYLADIAALERVLSCFPIAYFVEDLSGLDGFTTFSKENVDGITEKAKIISERREYLFSRLSNYYKNEG